VGVVVLAFLVFVIVLFCGGGCCGFGYVCWVVCYGGCCCWVVAFVEIVAVVIAVVSLVFPVMAVVLLRWCVFVIAAVDFVVLAMVLFGMDDVFFVVVMVIMACSSVLCVPVMQLRFKILVKEIVTVFSTAYKISRP
jgi:hypothetical protein